MKTDELSRQELLDIELSLDVQQGDALEEGKPAIAARLSLLRDKIHAARMDTSPAFETGYSGDL